MKTKRSIRGFTLIEVMIVISIMTILAGIVLAAFSRVHEDARRTSCTSNLMQIGYAVTMYRSDYDDKYPFAADPQIHATGGNIGTYLGMEEIGPELPMLPDVLSPYVKSRGIWHCPSDTGGVVVDKPYVAYESMYGKYGMSYAYDIFPAYSAIYPGIINTWKTWPAIPLLWDAGYHWHQSSNDWPGKRANTLFTDGHVKIQTLAQLSDYYTSSPDN